MISSDMINKSIVQRMGHQHLELCMIVIEELKKTFFGAEILYRIFTKAQKKIRERRLTPISAAPVTRRNDGSTSSSTIADDLMTEISQDTYQSNQRELDALSAMWNSFTPMIPYEFFDNTE
ncbi:hypothetical protein N0V90_005946 [Kalmusia sp. IMI 367209]|nr:hypothetical protein N0V90_005946 [Kalmusia sp. IMI 367209]